MKHEAYCQYGDCKIPQGRTGPYCEVHGCKRCGAPVLPELAHMPEPMCEFHYNDAKLAPAMKKHPREELLFHVAIEVKADKLSDSKLRREVLPGLIRSDGKPMDVKTFRAMCKAARARGWVVLPACDTINLSGQCRGHAAPKIDITTAPMSKLAN